jgi:glycoprotein endo-alpha-1,2-mannosidase
MRPLLLCVLVTLALPAPASAGAKVSAFFYPWYGTAARDGGFTHWSQAGHSPPNDIAANFYPARGLYSSSDRLVLGAQMDEIRLAGIEEIAVSWWGQGSAEDARLPAIIAAAHATGIDVAAHLEPYGGRSVASTVGDIGYLRALGIKTFYVYRALDLPIDEWAAANDSLQGVEVLAQTALAGAAAAAHFDGIYTYDILTYGGDSFARICGAAHAKGLLCAPSVGPGYDARRGSGDPRVKPRRDGATYDAMWTAAVASHADRVTITSYNEWHEGTQIEPAASRRRHGRYRYACYDGAWGLSGATAPGAYVARTSYWADVFRKTSAAQEKMSAS